MSKQNTSPTNSGELQPADGAILQHVALYRLTFAHPVQRLFFPAEDFDEPSHALRRAGDALHGLAGSGLLTCKEGKHELRFNKDFKYYVLTHRGAKTIGAKQTRPASNPNKDLAILWACTMEEKRFHRVTANDIGELFPKHTPHHNIPHILSEQAYDEGQSTCVLYRVYVTTSEPSDITKHCLEHYKKCCKNESLAPLVDVGDYGFAILVTTEERRKHVQKLLANNDGEKLSLSRLARFTVRLGPNHATLRQAIKGLPP